MNGREGRVVMANPGDLRMRSLSWRGVAASALLLSLAIAGAAAGGAGQALPGARPAATAWEYRTVRSSGGLAIESDQALNALGQEGWELVSVASQAPSVTIYVFKRPKGR